MPTLPRIAVRVIELCKSDRCELQELVDVISTDPGLTVKLLASVNSSYYGLNREVVTVSEATKLLGLRAVKTLTIAFCLSQVISEQCPHDFDLEGFWRRCLYSAVAAKLMAERIGSDIEEEAFTAALVQDIGLAAMVQVIGRDYQELMKSTGSNHSVLNRIEQNQLSTDHAQVGASLADRWGLPEILIDAIRYHHNPEDYKGENQQVVQIVNLSSLVADALSPEQIAVATISTFSSQLEEWLGIPEEQAHDLLNDVEEKSRKLGGSFKIKPRPQRDINKLLIQANDRLIKMAIESNQRLVELEKKNYQLKAAAQRDPLTGLANRRMFDSSLREGYLKSSEADFPLSLILFDIDHFKKINDEYGHLAGDRVLIMIARLLQEHEPDGGCIARFGGEEFTLVLPRLGVASAAQIAEHMRSRIEQLRFDIGGGKRIHATVSAGVAGRDHLRQLSSEIELLDCADKALYAAKSSGRNCVRVLRPMMMPRVTPDKPCDQAVD
ncbi:HDOD domain-containing protein [Poriferisphaera corsica]|uniref:HDOD domain-containing protein n=1 Tax=Poriferisphaera corsica TaxID=2528020 RepID=UPI00190E3997|nr:HDOD domain-containing protein [Poriferisphaera corsica]